jgi:hypothetical protein
MSSRRGRRWRKFYGQSSSEAGAALGRPRFCIYTYTCILRELGEWEETKTILIGQTVSPPSDGNSDDVHNYPTRPAAAARMARPRNMSMSG